MKNDDVDLLFSSFIILNWVEGDMMEEDSLDPINQNFTQSYCVDMVWFAGAGGHTTC